MTRVQPAVWLPTIRAGTGADVFAIRLCEGLNRCGIRAKIQWLPHRAEYLPLSVNLPRPPAWATVAHINSWLPWRFVPKNLPVVVTVHHLVHDPSFAPYRSQLQALYHKHVIASRERNAIRKAEIVTTVSNYVGSTINHFSGRSDISVISNWVDLQTFAPVTHQHNPNRCFRLFVAGTRSRRKGVDLLPRLSRILGSEFEIRYAGGGQNRVPGVVNLGRISEKDLLREYQRCDAVLSLSRYEGFGYTALEAMASGKPFIGFRTSGLIELVLENCGVLVDVDDLEEIAGAARRLAADPNLVRKLGANGRERAVLHFSEASAIHSYARSYGEAIDSFGDT